LGRTHFKCRKVFRFSWFSRGKPCFIIWKVMAASFQILTYFSRSTRYITFPVETTSLNKQTSHWLASYVDSCNFSVITVLFYLIRIFGRCWQHTEL
jgi:hypothetical protein